MLYVWHSGSKSCRQLLKQQCDLKSTHFISTPIPRTILLSQIFLSSALKSSRWWVIRDGSVSEPSLSVYIPHKFLPYNSLLCQTSLFAVLPKCTNSECSYRNSKYIVVEICLGSGMLRYSLYKIITLKSLSLGKFKYIRAMKRQIMILQKRSSQ